MAGRSAAGNRVSAERLNNAERFDAERFAALLQSVDVGLVLSGRGGKPRVWNQAALDFFGITESELGEMRPAAREWTAVHEDGSAFAQENPLADLIRPTKPVRNFMVGIRRPAPRQQVWLSINSSRLSSKNSTTYDAICTISDVTWLKRREDLFDPQQELFRRILETLPEAVALVTHDFGRFLYVSPAYEQIWGRTRESLYADGRSWLDAIPPEDHKAILAGLDRLLKNGETLSVEHRVVRTDHSIRWVEKLASRLADPQGGSSLIATSARDITARKNSESALIESKNRYDAAISASGQILYDWDLKKDHVTYSGNVEAILGYSPEELAGRISRWVKIIHPDDRESFEKQIERVLSTHLPFHLRYRVGKKSGRFLEVQGDGYFAADAQGNLVRMVGFIVDISERRKLEEQLRQAQKMESIGRLAGGIAHDFNNLLTVILGYNQLVRGELGPDHPSQRGIDEVERAGRRAEELTRQLLAFSRRQMLQPKVVDLGDIVSETEQMLRRLIGEDVEIRTVRRPHLGNVKADPGQIVHVLLNLAVNARDAMPDGGSLLIETTNVTLSAHDVESHPEINPGDYVMLSVTDTGTGMDAETQARIFEPFFTTKQVGKGTGLGLSMVYGTVRQSGGDVWVFSEPGKGTTFKIFLPRTDQNTEDVERAPRVDEARPDRAQSVLVVEDEDAIRDLIGFILRGAGYNVLEAQSGADAMNKLAMGREQVDLLLVDVIMPGMSGPELSAQLLNLRSDMRVLYISGYTEEIIYQRGILKPNTPFLRKPFSAQGLLQKIREILDLRDARK
jgi:two-component system cell cycle sensor histidine kinase/response regulator CckA